MVAAEADRIKAARLERQTKHEHLRDLVRWLIASRFAGKHIRLADQLDVRAPWLSAYMTGANDKGGRLTGSQLNDWSCGLVDALCESSGRGWREAACGHCPHRTRELHDASGRVDLGLGARPVVPTIETVEMVPCAGI